MQGSKSFTNYIKNRHSNIVNINLDTLGDKNKEILILGVPNPSHNVIDLLSGWFQQNKIGYSIEPDKYRSDHLSFQDADIPSISLVQEINDIIHTTEDKFAKVDVEFLHSFSNMVYDFINVTSDKIFDICAEGEHPSEQSKENEITAMPENQELEDLVQKVRSELKFGEYIVISKYDRIEKIYNNIGVFTNFDDFALTYSDVSTPFVSKNYTLEKITVFDNSFPEIGRDIVQDKVYKNEINSSNIGSIEYLYNSIKENGKLIFRLSLIDNKSPELPSNSKSEVITSDKGQQYTLTYNPDGRLIKITCNVDTSNKSYILTIRKGIIKDLTINNETHKNAFVYDWNINYNQEDIKEVINSINLNIFQ